jgi:hypothetical protein
VTARWNRLVAVEGPRREGLFEPTRSRTQYSVAASAFRGANARVRHADLAADRES